MSREYIAAGISLFAILIIACAVMLPGTSTSSNNLGGLATATGEDARTSGSVPQTELGPIKLRLAAGYLFDKETVTVGDRVAFAPKGIGADVYLSSISIEALGSESATSTTISITHVNMYGARGLSTNKVLEVKRGIDEFAYSSINVDELRALLAEQGPGWYRITAIATNSLNSQRADIWLFIRPAQ